MSDVFLTSPWSGLTLWSVLYISDYTLTIICARLYRQEVKDHIIFEGSYELNPIFQKDVDSLRIISPRFLLLLFLTDAFLAGYWLLSAGSLQSFYEFIFGMMIGIELMIHARHLRNLFLFHAINSGQGVRGRIEYSRSLLLYASSKEFLVFSGFFLLLFVLTGSWFVLGGTFGCLSVAGKHWRLARKCRANATAAAQRPQET